jgi:hypothetical protein
VSDRERETSPTSKLSPLLTEHNGGDVTGKFRVAFITEQIVVPKSSSGICTRNSYVFRGFIFLDRSVHLPHCFAN